MKVAMLAAGVGRRLAMGEDAPPKVLLRFDGVSLLQRHLDILAHFGLLDLTLAVGHQAGAIEAELGTLGARGPVRTRFNPDYREAACCRSGRFLTCSPPDKRFSTWTPTCSTIGA
jgi:choline kinase